MNNPLLISSIYLAALVFIGCSERPAQQPLVQSPPVTEGTSSGGGGFGDENSTKLLDWSKMFTAASIRRVNPDAFKSLPNGWTQERLAKLIESVRSEPQNEAVRYNRELMFDYRVPKSGEPYLIATALFFRSHSAVPVNSLAQSSTEPYLQEIRTKLLHEAAHVLGIGLTEKTDIKARAFSAYLIIEILSKNNILCETNDVPKNYPGYVSKADIENTTIPTVYSWAINRPTGFALQSLRSPILLSRSWLKKMRAGKVVYHSSFSLMGWDDFLGQITPNFVRLYRNPNEVLMAKGRLAPQYYKELIPISGKSAVTTLFGRDDYSVVQSDSSYIDCHYEEQIELPKNSKGAFEAVISYQDTCGLYDENRGHNPLDVEKISFKTQCIESFQVLDHNEEFTNPGVFTNPWLREWEKVYGTID